MILVLTINNTGEASSTFNDDPPLSVRVSVNDAGSDPARILAEMRARKARLPWAHITQRNGALAALPSLRLKTATRTALARWIATTPYYNHNVRLLSFIGKNPIGFTYGRAVWRPLPVDTCKGYEGCLDRFREAMRSGIASRLPFESRTVRDQWARAVPDLREHIAQMPYFASD